MCGQDVPGLLKWLGALKKGNAATEPAPPNTTETEVPSDVADTNAATAGADSTVAGAAGPGNAGTVA